MLFDAVDMKPATKRSHFLIIETLADTIWRSHYPSIISMAQIDYMLAKFNSVSAIEAQVTHGALFFYITHNHKPVGYISIKNEDHYLFLSKFYILKAFRGRGIGTYTFNFIEAQAKAFNLDTIILKVNKHNTTSILAYEKLGFKKKRAIITDIGQGFIMDDFEFVKRF